MFDHKEIITEDMLDIRDAIMEAEGTIRVVGGAVRDLLMNRTPKDIDFATDLTPGEVMAVAVHGKLPGARLIEIETGIEHGTVTLYYKGTNYEITTLRKDIETDGRHATVQFTKDWREDAERRDFTINAMSMDFEGRVFDYFDGRADLDNYTVRFVGDPDARIQEDYIRILRYFRMCSKLHVVPRKDDPAIAAIQRNAKGLARVSGERIAMEMREILASNEADDLLRMMHYAAVFPAIGLPINVDFHEIRQVCERTRNPITRLTAGLRERKDPFVTENFLTTLKDHWKVKGHESELARFLIIEDSVFTPGYRSIKDFQRMVLLHKIKLEWAIELAAFQGAEFLNRLKMWTPIRMPVTGNDLIQLGMQPGKDLGEVLDLIKERWILHDFKYSRAELLSIAQEVVTRFYGGAYVP